nr:novel protein [Danio rerio]
MGICRPAGEISNSLQMPKLILLLVMCVIFW